MLDIKNMRIIKYPHVISALFFIFLGLSKEEINVKDPI